MRSISTLPPEIDLQVLRAAWEQYSVTGDTKIRDRIFEGLMRKVYVWCWHWTKNYIYGDEAYQAALEKLATCIDVCIDLPYLRRHTTGACLTYIRDHQPSVRRYTNSHEIYLDDIMKVDIHGTAIMPGYELDDLIIDLRLDPQELRVLKHLLDGDTTSQIALKMRISDRHVRRITAEIRTLVARIYNYRRPTCHA